MTRSEGPADLALVGGAVVTLDAARRTASAIAIRAGTIVAVGSDAAIAAFVGPRTRRIDLAGRTALPGFQDAHCHPVLAGVHLSRCALHGVPRSIEGYRDAIRAFAEANPALSWIVGAGWSMSAFPGGTPSFADLDLAVPDRPAFLTNRDGHGAWVNSRALRLAGIGRDTSDPADGRIERDASGEPSGTLHEGAMELVRRLVPEPTTEDLVGGLGLAQAYLHRLGITAWQDAWVDRQGLEAYRVFVGRGGLTGRVIACQWWDRARGAEQVEEMVQRRAEFTIGRLRATTVKIMQDGVVENFTAAMLEPYRTANGRPTTNTGLSFVEPEALKSHVTRLDAEGFQVHFHALGDRAVREALDAVEAARRANGPSDGRPHLAHLQVVDPADIPRFRALGAAANIQPYWACNEPQMVELTLPFLAPERAALQYPFASLERAGARLVGGSDWSVSTPNVLAQVEVAVNRVSPEDRTTEPFLPRERLSLTSALAAFTNGSAWINRLEASTGSLEVGKAADVVVLDRDLDAADPRTIGDARVLLTLVDGQAVHEDPGLERA